MNKISLAVGVSAIALLFGANLASAQELDVTKRPLPEYDPVGMPVGSFLVFPKLEFSETYNGNIYAQETGETDDFVTRIAPSVAVNSDWSNHALNVVADAVWGVYADNSDEDFIDYGIAADGRLDVQRSSNVFGGLSYRRLHEERGSPNDVRLSTEPTEYDRVMANLGVTYKPNRFGVTVEGDWHDLDYDDTRGTTGNVINNDDRDRGVWGGRLRLGYDIQPDYTAFIQGSFNERDYDNVPDDRNLNRNSDGYRVDVGMEFRVTGTVDGEVFVGYFDQDYEDQALADVSDFDVGGNLVWSVTPLTTIKGLLARDVNETVVASASSFVSTAVAVDVDHELRRNFLIGGTVVFANNDYEGISRDDDIIRLGLRARYLITRNFYAGANAGYTDRDSSVASFSYDQFRVGLTLGAQF